MLVHLAEHVKRVPQDLVALELRLGPVRRPLLDLKRIPIPEVLREHIHRLAKHALSLALLHFERTNLVDQVVAHIAQVQGVQHAESEVNGELQAGIVGCGLDGLFCLVKHKAESLIAGVLQRQPVLRLIHAEAARTARARRKENVVVDDVLARQAFFLEELEMLHQIPHREIRRVALPVVAVFLADLERRHIRHRQLLATVSAALKYGADQILVLPGEAAKKNRDFAALLCRKRALHRPVEVSGLVEAGDLAQAYALRFQTLLDLEVVFNLNELRCHTRLLSF